MKNKSEWYNQRLCNTNCPSVYRGTSLQGGGSSKRSAENNLTTRYACNAPVTSRHPLYKQRGSWVAVCALICILFSLPSFAQVTVNASIDSLQLYIGEQTRVKLEVSCPAESQLVMPAYEEGLLMPGIEIVGEVKADTQYLNKKKQMLVSQEYMVTSFDSAFYYIPPFEVLVDSQSYASNPLALMVYHFPVDTTNVEAICPIKDIVKVKLTFADLWLMLLAIVLLAGFVVLIVYLMKRYNDDKPILKRVTIAPKQPAHQVALKEMNRIKEEKSWQRDDVKQYYTELTDALRVYMEERFGFNAMEMTSDEIIAHLNEQPDKEWIDELRTLFNMSDLVKFAKYMPLINENDMNLITAIDFVNKTKVEEVAPAAPVTQEIVVKEGRSKQERTLLLGGIIVLGLCGVAALYVALSRIIHLFF